jgi:hypothetical protein
MPGKDKISFSAPKYADPLCGISSFLLNEHRELFARGKATAA